MSLKNEIGTSYSLKIVDILILLIILDEIKIAIIVNKISACLQMSSMSVTDPFIEAKDINSGPLGTTNATDL